MFLEVLYSQSCFNSHPPRIFHFSIKEKQQNKTHLVEKERIDNCSSHTSSLDTNWHIILIEGRQCEREEKGDISLGLVSFQ